MIWDIDPVQSQVSFALRVMRVTTTRGHFTTVRGQIHIDEQHPAKSWVVAAVEAASIDTRNPLRDAHLRSAAFFDVAQYPMMTFQSTSVEQIGGYDYRVTGNLTLHGITRPVTFNVIYQGQDMEGPARPLISASTTLNRHEFGVGRGAAVRIAASGFVAIELALALLQQPEPVHDGATASAQ